MSRRAVVAVAVLAALVIGVLGYRRLTSGDDRSQLRYQTAAVQRGPLVAKVTATGTLSALVTVQVGSQVSGRIQAIHVDFNSPVKKGQLIARIDPQMFEAAIEQARANHLAAQGNLTRARVQAEDAQRQLERQKQLFERQLIARADLDTAEATARAAAAGAQASEGAVAQARAALNQAQINLAYTNILSPIDGVVISRNVDVGQTVAASLQAPTLFTIAEDLTRMQVDTNVAEADVGKLQPGMEASFTVDAFPRAPFTGRIRQIRNAPITVQNVVTYDAVIDVENPELKLKPGMTANVTIEIARADDALKVANAALRFRPPPQMTSVPRGDKAAGGGSERARRAPSAAARADEPRVVWVLRDGVPQKVPVELGLTDGTSTEVRGGGLKEGDQVITDASSGAGSGSGGGRPGGAMGGMPRRMF